MSKGEAHRQKGGGKPGVLKTGGPRKKLESTPDLRDIGSIVGTWLNQAQQIPGQERKEEGSGMKKVVEKDRRRG